MLLSHTVCVNIRQLSLIFVSSGSLKLKDGEEMLCVVASLHETKTEGCGGGVAGNSPVKVYKQGKEPAVQEDKR